MNFLLYPLVLAFLIFITSVISLSGIGFIYTLDTSYKDVWLGIDRYNSLKYFFTQTDTRLESFLIEVAQLARKEGFIFSIPEIRLTRPRVVDRSFLAYAFSWINLIVINHNYLDQHSDAKIKTIIAHELGHYIGDKMSRRGHKFFTKTAHLNDEYLADAFAAFLYSKKAVVDMRAGTDYVLDINLFNQIDLGK